MNEELVFNFSRVDILTTSNQHVLRTPSDRQIAVGTYRSKITGMEPAVGFDSLCRCRRISIIILEHAEAPQADLSYGIDGQRGTGTRLHDPNLSGAEWRPNSL